MKNDRFCQNPKAREVEKFCQKNKNIVLRTKSVQKFYKFLINSPKNQANSRVSGLRVNKNVFFVF